MIRDRRSGLELHYEVPVTSLPSGRALIPRDVAESWRALECFVSAQGGADFARLSVGTGVSG